MKPFTSLDPGRMDRRVTLLAPLPSRDAAGGVVTAWTTVGTVWAEFNPQPGREIQQAGQKLALAVASFRIRWRATVTAAWRLIHDSNVYELLSPPVEVGRREALDLVARALDRSDLAINGVGIQSLLVNLTAGDVTKAVTYTTPFSAAPAGVWCKVLPPDGGNNIDANPLESTRLAAGFTAQLGAAIPASGYKLSVIAVQ